MSDEYLLPGEVIQQAIESAINKGLPIHEEICKTQIKETLRLATPGIEAKAIKEVVDYLGVYENELGFCEISNHVPYSAMLGGEKG